MYRHRPLTISDAPIIAGWPVSRQELFYFFPKAAYPLRPEMLLKEAERRFNPTAVTLNGKLAGYGNFLYIREKEEAAIGNLIVNPDVRKKGVAQYLMETLMADAFSIFRVIQVKISCFNRNTEGLLLYHKLGFVPAEWEVRQNYQEENFVLIHMYRSAPSDISGHSKMA